MSWQSFVVVRAGPSFSVKNNDYAIHSSTIEDWHLFVFSYASLVRKIGNVRFTLRRHLIAVHGEVVGRFQHLNAELARLSQM
jgi:hypothetical protein